MSWSVRVNHQPSGVMRLHSGFALDPKAPSRPEWATGLVDGVYWDLVRDGRAWGQTSSDDELTHHYLPERCLHCSGVPERESQYLNILAWEADADERLCWCSPIFLLQNGSSLLINAGWWFCGKLASVIKQITWVTACTNCVGHFIIKVCYLWIQHQHGPVLPFSWNQWNQCVSKCWNDIWTITMNMHMMPHKIIIIIYSIWPQFIVYQEQCKLQ